MKKLAFILLLFSALCSNAQSNKQSVLENKILDTIFCLPEVKEKAENVEKLSHNKRHLSGVIYERPTKDFDYYWIEVWEDNGGTYVTHFNFYVQPKSLEIKFYDVIDDKVFDLNTWRKLRKKN